MRHSARLVYEKIVGHRKLYQSHEGEVNQAVLVLNKESVASIETARGVLNFGFSAIRIKVYKGDSNAASSSVGNPAEQVLAEELEAPAYIQQAGQIAINWLKKSSNPSWR